MERLSLWHKAITGSLPRRLFEVTVITLFITIVYLGVPFITTVDYPPKPRTGFDRASNVLSVETTLDKYGLLELINNERALHDLDPLKRVGQMERAASSAAHAVLEDQLSLLKDKQYWQGYLLENGYKANQWDTLFTYGHSSNASVMEWFRSEPTANKSILDPDYSEVGISVSLDVFSGDDVELVTIYLASPSEEIEPPTSLANTESAPPSETPAPSDSSQAQESVSTASSPASASAGRSEKDSKSCNTVASLLNTQCITKLLNGLIVKSLRGMLSDQGSILSR